VHGALYGAEERVRANGDKGVGHDIAARAGGTAQRDGSRHVISLDVDLGEVSGERTQLAQPPAQAAGVAIRYRERDEGECREDLRSFLACLRGRYLGPELRIVIPQPLFDQINISEVLKAVRDGARTRLGWITVLDYILRLELTEARWNRVDDLLAIAVEAAAVGDVGTLWPPRRSCAQSGECASSGSAVPR
jgi:hypothetical protein